VKELSCARFADGGGAEFIYRLYLAPAAAALTASARI